MAAHPPRKSLGMRLTEKLLLPITGPADVGDSRRRTPVTDEQKLRAAELDAGLTRLTRPDGSTYLVVREAGRDEDAKG